MTVVVCDAGCLERNLILTLQVMELTDNVVVCVNLMDEAARHGVEVDLDALSRRRGGAASSPRGPGGSAGGGRGRPPPGARGGTR